MPPRRVALAALEIERMLANASLVVVRLAIGSAVDEAAGRAAKSLNIIVKLA